ncbi:MAG: peptidyl-prolyl cis-trans isomerase (rotamase) - cyclophilin family [Actinomycetia bacterium]|nr:peptidyl-prolyl cis-trans isomerase (rotamase) - cyclophilin family [Actinomycetes bacterium]
MSKATKRERQRQNREDRRLRELQAQKRSNRFKSIRNGGIVLALLVAIFVIVQVVNSNSNSKKKTTSTTTTSTTAAATTSAGPRPAGSPPLSIDPAATYTATIDTTQGTMVVALDTTDAKWGANNFITLARKGFYDGTSFERAAKDFVIQGGSPKSGTKRPASFVSELPQKAYAVGDILYAKSGSAQAGTADSTFFVITSDAALTTLQPNTYSDFGHLTSGLDVAKKIEGFAPASGDGPPTTPVTINKITIDGPPPTTGSTASTTTAPVATGATTTSAK